MSGRSKRWLPVAGGVGFLLLLAFSLRPLGFIRHYSTHLFHLRTGHTERARVELFRAVHFNPVPTLVKGGQKVKIMDAVFFQAARKDDLSEIMDFTSPVFPFEIFRDRYAGNPWFQALVKADGDTMDWRNIGEAGFRLLSDSGVAAMLISHLGESAAWPTSYWTRRMAVVAWLGGNGALALRLDPMIRSREILSTIRKVPERGGTMAGKGFSRGGKSFILPMDPSLWNLQISGEGRNGLAGFVQTGQNSVLLMAGQGGKRRSAVATMLNPGISMQDQRYRIRVDYLAELEGGRLALQGGVKMRWKLPSTGGKWSRIFVTHEPRPGSVDRLRLVLSGGGLVVVSGIQVAMDADSGGENG